MFWLIGLAISFAASILGYSLARDFTHRRLRYVSAVHSLRAPILAGLAAVLLATPVTWLLPLVGAGTAIAFGLSVGMGVTAGAREIRRLNGY